MTTAFARTLGRCCTIWVRMGWAKRSPNREYIEACARLHRALCATERRLVQRRDESPADFVRRVARTNPIGETRRSAKP